MRFGNRRASLALVTVVQCTWGTYDASSTSDAGLDAGTDVGLAPVVCSGNETCSEGTTCCIPDQSGPPFCAGPGACSNGTLVACNSSASCPEGEVCCIGGSDAGAEYELSCVAASQCPSAQIACVGSNDCSGSACPSPSSGSCRLDLSSCGGPTPACNPQ